MHVHLNRNQPQNKTFSRLYKAKKTHLLAIWALSPIQMTYFPNLLYTSTSKIPTLSYALTLKRYPVWADPLRIGHYRVSLNPTPPPPPTPRPRQ